jgi:hypothetical protein
MYTFYKVKNHGGKIMAQSNLTERENLQLVYDGKQPEWVPIARESADFTMNGFLTQWHKPGVVSTDVFGVKYFTEDPRVGPMPIAGQPLLKNIREWREKVLFPDLKNLDWEDWAAKDTARWNRQEKMSQIMMSGSASGAVFQLMVTLMSHEGALYSLADEDDEEEWHALLGSLTSWTEELIKNTIKYYKPDVICICDDNASKNSSFMSPATFRKMIKPYHKRLVQTVVDCGCIPTLHCCGNVEKLFADFVEIGYRGWDPSQVQNDLKGMKATYGKNIVFFGGWDSQGVVNQPGAREEDVRAAVRRSFDILAPGGGYVWSTSGMLLPWDIGEEQAGWVSDEARKCSREFYRNKG